MNKKRVFILFFLMAFFAQRLARADNATIHISAYTEDNSSGTAVEGNVNVDTCLYGALTGGESLWCGSAQTVTAESGILSFDVNFLEGEGALSADTLPTELFLEIAIDSDTLSPRIEMGTVPYAILATSCLTAATLATNAIGGDASLDALGQLTIANSAVTSAKVADSAITSAKISDGTIAAADILDSAITSAKITDATITGSDLIASLAITTSGSIQTSSQAGFLLNPFGTAVGNTSEFRLLELAANGANYVGFKAPDSIATNRIWTLPSADGANGEFLRTNGTGTLSWGAAAGGGGTPDDNTVTSAKIVADTIVAADIADGAVATAEILDGTIATADIAASAITSALISDGVVASADITDATIVAGDLADGAVTSAKILDGTIASADILDGTIAAADIAAGTITTTEIALDTIAAADIAADAVGTSEIATDGVAAAEIAADAVGTSEIATDGVGAAEIAADAVGTSEIATGGVATAEILDNDITATDLNATLTFADADLLNLSAINASGTAEGLILPQAADVSAATAEGQISWDTDGNELFVGTSGGIARIYTAGATDVAVADGGTGASTFTLNGVLYGNAANALLVTAQGAANSVLTANAGAPAFSTTPTVTSLTATAAISAGTTFGSPLYTTATNCSSAAAPAVCGASAAGAVTIPTTGATKIVNTTAVTANSRIFVTEDSSLGADLGVTCNTVLGRTYVVTARTAATSFTITSSATPAGNPACLSYLIFN